MGDIATRVDRLGDIAAMVDRTRVDRLGDIAAMVDRLWVT